MKTEHGPWYSFSSPTERPFPSKLEPLVKYFAVYLKQNLLLNYYFVKRNKIFAPEVVLSLGNWLLTLDEGDTELTSEPVFCLLPLALELHVLRKYKIGKEVHI